MPTKLPAHLLHGGHLMQVARAETRTFMTGSNGVAANDQIPTSADGMEVVTIGFTPKSASSLLRVTGLVQLSWAYNYRGAAFICQDSISNALESSFSCGADAGDLQQNALVVQHWVSSGSTTARTFKLRAGANTTYYVNGYSTRWHGGKLSSWIMVEEISS